MLEHQIEIVDGDLGEILEVLSLYHDAHYYLDLNKLERAFHVEAQIVGHYHDEAFIAKRSEYKAILSSETSSASRNEPTYTRLLSLDRTETTALAKIESLMAGETFTSMLSIWKTKNGWQIINGLFHLETLTTGSGKD
ncbi:MAG: hypothetical protein HON65_08550 [Rhodospirillales bacterium]|jgi:hypothetical protein|nr:hypothetical protein [Rhodospirillales bacterium]